MPLIELPRAETELTVPEAAAEPREIHPAGVHEPDDADFIRLFKLGALVGTPAVYVVLAGVCWLAAPGHPLLLVAVLWPALVAGWYFGGIVVLTLFELRQERARRQRAVPAPSFGKLLAHPRPARLAH